MKKLIVTIVILVCCGMSFTTFTASSELRGESGSVEQAGKRLKRSPVYITVWGYGELEEGDVVAVYDRDGVLCGRFKVETAGIYGQMAVYGDYAPTGETDEGAERGEELIIKVNGEEIIPRLGGLIWEGGDGRVIRLDL